jgi:hypothetical protein
MEPTNTASEGKRDAHAFARPLPEYVDWLVGVIIAVGGMALTVGGSALTFVVDRGFIEEDIESGQMTVIVFERELTEAQNVELALEIVNWTGLGLLVTGIGLVLFAAGYVVMRYRTRRSAGEDERVDTYRSYAVLGAASTAVLSFIPFSPVIGGGVAGYLEHTVTGRSIGVGALAGFLAMVPGLIIMVFVTIGLYAGFNAAEEGGLGIVVATGMSLVLVFVSAYGAGLGAVGGFAGSWLAEND